MPQGAFRSAFLAFSLQGSGPRARRTPVVNLKACHCCGLVQSLPPVPAGGVAFCARCGVRIHDPRRSLRGNRMCRGAALGSLILFPLAIFLPVMRLEQFGHVTDASIWSGSVGLLVHGEWFVGSVVLVCSVILPLAKIVALLGLSSFPRRFDLKQRAWIWRAIEWTGRWGMLDVLLVALVVAWVKFGDVAEVRPGPGTVAFTGCVLLNLLASAWFDPHSLWEEEEVDVVQA